MNEQETIGITEPFINNIEISKTVLPEKIKIDTKPVEIDYEKYGRTRVECKIIEFEIK